MITTFLSTKRQKQISDVVYFPDFVTFSNVSMYLSMLRLIAWVMKWSFVLDKHILTFVCTNEKSDKQK